MTPSERWKIAIVGVGAMGSIYAAMMAEAKHEVWAIDSWDDHVEAINAAGLRLEGPGGSRTVNRIRATSRIEDAGACDLYVIATKANAVGEAARGVAGVMRPDSLVLTIQNGLGAGDRIAAHMATDNVLLGVADGFGASIRGPGHAHHNAMRLIRLGEMAAASPRGCKGWKRCGRRRIYGPCLRRHHAADLGEVRLQRDAQRPCTAFDCNVGALMANDDAWEVALGCAREAHACGIAEGVNFSFEDLDRYVTDFASLMPNASPSLRLDHLAGKPSEIDAINGMVPALGARHGIATPFNETLAAIVRAREAAFGSD